MRLLKGPKITIVDAGRYDMTKKLLKGAQETLKFNSPITLLNTKPMMVAEVAMHATKEHTINASTFLFP